MKKQILALIFSALSFILLLLASTQVLAGWIGYSDFSSCPRKYYPRISGKEGPFNTEADCQTRIRQAQSEDRAICIRYSCVEEGGAASTETSSAEPGHQLDKNIGDALSAGMQGNISAGDTAGLVSLGLIGNMLLAPTPAVKPKTFGELETERIAAENAAAWSTKRERDRQQKKDAHAAPMLALLEPVPTSKLSSAEFTIKEMNDLAKKLGWSDKELTRLNKSLTDLVGDGDSFDTPDSVIAKTWDTLKGRPSGLYESEAKKGYGPDFPAAGKQSGQDCALFALANATGEPYSIVSARAGELLREGKWREDHANLEQAVKAGGLNGGEVIMLAESFGQAKVVEASEFSSQLKAGHPVLLNLVPPDGSGGHEVVLTKSFQHEGETWYEMMDSNQSPDRRLYLSHKELRMLQQEKGVVYEKDEGKTPILLR